MPLLSIAWAIAGNPWARLIAAVIGAYLFGFYSVEQPDIAAITRNAEAGRDAEWSRKLAAQEESARAAVDAAIEARDHSPALQPDASLAELCKRTASCRPDQGR